MWVLNYDPHVGDCYVGNDPINRNDPKGLAGVCATSTADICISGPSDFGKNEIPKPSTGAVVGAAAGAAVGVAAAGACDLGTGGICVVGNPAIVGGAMVAGAVVGNGVEKTVKTAINLLSSKQGSEAKGQNKPEVGKCPDCGGRTSNRPDKIAQDQRMKPQEVRDKIHELKGGRIINNPDVEVCKNCGEVFPQTGNGLGESIGNIGD